MNKIEKLLNMEIHYCSAAEVYHKLGDFKKAIACEKEQRKIAAQRKMTSAPTPAIQK